MLAVSDKYLVYEQQQNMKHVQYNFSKYGSSTLKLM